jgi:hypothetical protein
MNLLRSAGTPGTAEYDLHNCDVIIITRRKVIRNGIGC